MSPTQNDDDAEIRDRIEAEFQRKEQLRRSAMNGRLSARDEMELDDLEGTFNAYRNEEDWA